MRLSHAIIFATLLTAACSKDEPSGNNLVSQPEALAAYDNSQYGVYKGTVVGSSGFIEIKYKNGDDKIEATIKIDGTTKTITGTVDGGTVHFNSESITFSFGVQENGNEPGITAVSIDGHPHAILILLKEKSTRLIKVYEGTYSGTDAGVFNIAIGGETLKGVGRRNETNDGFYIAGTVNGNNITITTSNASGTISGNNINGTWEDNNSGSGTWTGSRTL